MGKAQKNRPRAEYLSYGSALHNKVVLVAWCLFPIAFLMVLMGFFGLAVDFWHSLAWFLSGIGLSLGLWPLLKEARSLPKILRIGTGSLGVSLLTVGIGLGFYNPGGEMSQSNSVEANETVNIHTTSPSSTPDSTSTSQSAVAPTDERLDDALVPVQPSPVEEPVEGTLSGVQPAPVVTNEVVETATPPAWISRPSVVETPSEAVPTITPEQEYSSPDTSPTPCLDPGIDSPPEVSPLPNGDGASMIEEENGNAPTPSAEEMEEPSQQEREEPLESIWDAFPWLAPLF